ncbi:hypothetical protein ES705_09108 [subsurface metagenome]
MTLTRPSVSTAVSFLTKAFLPAIFFIPILKTTVITTTRPSGTADTAKLIAILNASIICSISSGPNSKPSVSSIIIISVINTPAQINRIAIPNSFPNRFTST